MWTILSGVFGGVLRLVPEVIKAWNRKKEMDHELNMQKLAYDFQVLKGKQKVDMIVERGAADWNTNAIDTLKASIEAQAKLSGVKWIDGFSALMRPLITFQWVVCLYPSVITASFILLYLASDRSPAAIADAVIKSFGAEEKAVVAFIIDFWFVGRALEAGRKRYGNLANKV